TVVVDHERRLAPFGDAVLQTDVIHVVRVHRRQLSRPLVDGAAVSSLPTPAGRQTPRLCATCDARGGDLLDTQSLISWQPIGFGHHAAGDAVLVLDVHA